MLRSPAMFPPKRPATHSHVMVPFILAAMDLDHPGTGPLIQKYGIQLFQDVVGEIRIVLDSKCLPHPPRVLRKIGMFPYVDADDQNTILDHHFKLFSGGGQLQVVQTDVVMAEAKASQPGNPVLPLDTTGNPFQASAGNQFGDQFGNKGQINRPSCDSVIATPLMAMSPSSTPQLQSQPITNQFGTPRNHGRMQSGVSPTTCVFNTIPDTVSVPLCDCHPVLLDSAATIILPGTAFQLVMGGHRQKIVCGAFLSPSEWYCDGFTRPRYVSDGIVQFDFKNYPGSHIPMTRTDPSLWSTMFLTRVDAKVFEQMLKKMDPRIVNEIHRRKNPEIVPIPTLHSACASKYECTSCKRTFTSSKGLQKHVCDPTQITDVARLTCSICTKTFSTAKYLERHMREWHGSLNSTKIGGEPSPLPNSTTARPTSAVSSPFNLVDCTKLNHRPATVIPAPAPVITPKPKVMLCDTPDNSSEDEANSAPKTKGLSGDEIFAIASSWQIGQEYVMTYKEKETEDEYEAHGMFLRWDVTKRESPGMSVCYLDEEGGRSQRKKRQRYCEEYLDCTASYVVLSLTTVPPSDVFDPKRREMNREM